jgi:hypothetical protein
MDELPSFIQKDIRTDIQDIYNKLNHLKELLQNNENCHCCILELKKCENCKHIICPNCDERQCDVCKKINCKKCLIYKTFYPDSNILAWYTCNDCKDIKLYDANWAIDK